MLKILNELDEEEAAKSKKAEVKRLREVARARKQMAVGKRQPSIVEPLRVAKEKSRRVDPKSSQVEVDNQLIISKVYTHVRT